jgi:outer membrane lipoprotein-sorting protein
VIDTYREDPKSFSPDKILVNVPNNYNATLLADGKKKEEPVVLKLIPKDDKSQVKWMKIWIDREDWLMQKVQMEDISDNITTYAISDIKLNTNLADSIFQFLPPKNVEVIDLR